MDKIQISIRVEPTLSGYIKGLSEEFGLNYTEAIETIMKIGLQNRHDVKTELEKKRILAVESIKFFEADAFLNIELKKAYLVENFRKLLYHLIQARDMSANRRKAAIAAMLQRVEDIFGKNSEEYKDCEKMINNKEGK